jgi:hypothetical protein
MRFVGLYLVGYVVLVIGVLLALWKSGVFYRAGPVSTGIGLVIAIGLGIMLSVSAGKPATTEVMQQ